ncbi:uncharacterized protein [Onthophagus taurus]|uniref:uncharacterized protein n=1 Tax=Onthophagus taurus TaxID=166361 RepID=UPI0039BDEE0C
MFDIEKFIDAIEERPALYNLANNDYHNRDLKIRLWEEIGEIMYLDWAKLNNKEKNERGKTMQKKWKSVRDSFNRELRLQKFQKSGDSATNRKTYEYFNKLLFLLPNSENRETATNVSVQLDDNGNNNNLSETPSTSGTHKKKRKSNFEEELLNILQSKKAKSNDIENDSDRMFLLSFLNDMKTLSLQTKNWVKMQFMQIMQQATTGLNVGQLSHAINVGPSTPQINRHSIIPFNCESTGHSSQNFESPSPAASSTMDSDIYDMYTHL